MMLTLAWFLSDRDLAQVENLVTFTYGRLGLLAHLLPQSHETVALQF